MTVEKLVVELQMLPQELEVMIYIGEAEEYGSIDKVLVRTERNLPYAKGSMPELADNEKIVIIEGWII